MTPRQDPLVDCLFYLKLSHSQILHIFVEISQGRGNHGDFLKNFAECISRADDHNFAILMPAAIAIAMKYELGEYLDNYVAANFP